MATKSNPKDGVKDCTCHQQGKCNECKAAKRVLNERKDKTIRTETTDSNRDGFSDMPATPDIHW